jgi:pimeloyl-ACP methyl ester carboxylesterase
MKIAQNLALRYTRARINILSLASPRKAALEAFRLFATPQQRPAGKGTDLYRKGDRLSFHHDGHTIRGRVWLPADPPVRKILVAHGWESNIRFFEDYLPLLLEKGCEVVAFDAPAHGASGGKRFLLPNYVQALRHVEQHHGPFDAYIGHSLGGLALALLLESSPHNETTRLVLIAPAVETTTALSAFGRMLHLSPEIIRGIDEYCQEISGHHFEWYSLRRALSAIHARVLYLQDQTDRVTPLKEALAVQKDGHPNIQFVFTTDLGHRRIAREPAIMEQIVDFIVGTQSNIH